MRKHNQGDFMSRAGLTSSLASIAAAALLLLPPTIASAVLTVVTSQETPSCDVLQNLTLVDELGLAPIFPANELIDASATQTTLSACPATDNPNLPNALIRMRNLTPTPWFDLHYVADPNIAGIAGTTISNEDGLVNLGQAFRIDTIGVNKPLINESINPNGLFEPGEFWTFVIDDYQNSGAIGPAQFTSIGVGSRRRAGRPAAASSRTCRSRERLAWRARAAQFCSRGDARGLGGDCARAGRCLPHRSPHVPRRRRRRTACSRSSTPPTATGAGGHSFGRACVARAITTYWSC
jgi:hypothetical protein